MHGLGKHDGGREIDWGKTSLDYATYRPGYPASFFERLAALGVGLAGQRVLDLATGTGVLAREFAARGCAVVGIDIAPGQIEAARRLAEAQGLTLDLDVGEAEDTGLPTGSFDVVTCSQAWHYFDHDRAIPEVRRLLAPGGQFVTSHLCWLPRKDGIARASEALVLKHNPAWSAADWSGEVPAVPEWAVGRFELAAMFHYDVALPFTRESWRGRFRACRGVGATLSDEEVRAFDAEHARLLESSTPADGFTVLHRIDAHVFRNIIIT